jgi:hypothetical protein
MLKKQFLKIKLNTKIRFWVRPLGRPRRRWDDNNKMDLQEVGRGCGDWIELA